MTDVVELRVGGSIYTAWTEARVSRDLDSMAGDFEFKLVKDPAKPNVIAPAIAGGESCQVYVASILQLTGWVDEPEYDLSPTALSLIIRGRGKTGDLVDCSAIHEPGTWSNRTVQQIEADLLKPFGLTVAALASTGAAFPSFAIQPGEKVFEVMTRLQKQRAVLAIETADGNVQLIRPGQTSAGFALQQGVNILRVRHKHSHHKRFSEYVLKGQSQGRDSSGDWLTGAPPTHKSSPLATATDPGVTRYRPLEIINEGQAFDSTLGQRAQWEATVRYGQAFETVLTVPEWRDPTGKVWAFDRLAPVTCPAVGLNGEALLIKGVDFRLTVGGGQVSDLKITRKEAYSLLDLPDPKKPKKGKKRKGPDPLLALQ